MKPNLKKSEVRASWPDNFSNPGGKKKDFNDRVNNFLDGPYCVPVCLVGIALCLLVAFLV